MALLCYSYQISSAKHQHEIKFNQSEGKHFKKKINEID